MPPKYATVSNTENYIIKNKISTSQNVNNIKSVVTSKFYFSVFALAIDTDLLPMNQGPNAFRAELA